MKKNNTEHIYIIHIDSGVDDALRKFEEQLAEDEQIVSQSVNETLRVIVVTTRTPHVNTMGRPKNLLLEELQSKKGVK
jgi:hypothetical protein